MELLLHVCELAIVKPLVYDLPTFFVGVSKVVGSIPSEINCNVEVAKDHFPITRSSIKYGSDVFPILVVIPIRAIDCGSIY